MQNTEKAALEELIRELQMDLDAERDHHRYWHTVATVALSILASGIASLLLHFFR